MTRRALVAVPLLIAVRAAAAPDPRAAGVALLETADARTTGVAGAATALTGDVGAAAANPAAAATLEGSQLSTQFQSSLGDVRTGLLAYGRGNGRAGWTLTSVFFDAGRIEIVPASGPSSTRRAQQDLVGALAGGFALGPSLRLGAAAKILSSTLVERYHAAAVAGDAGLQWDLSPRWGLAVAARNLGGDLTYRQTADPLPTEYRAGLAFRTVSGEEGTDDPDVPWYTRFRSRRNYVALTGDAVLDGEGAVAGALGLEWDYAHRAILRAGGKIGEDGEQFSMGLGFWLKGWRLDYSFQAVGELSDRHRATVSWFWNKRPRE